MLLRFGIFILIGLVCIACQSPPQEQKNSLPLATIETEPEEENTLSQTELPPMPMVTDSSRTARSASTAWHLVSLPITESTSLKSFLTDYPTVRSIWSWNTAHSSWKVFPKIEGFESIESLDPFTGYWLLAPKDLNLPIVSLTDSPNLVEEGWSLMGFRGNNTETVGEVLQRKTMTNFPCWFNGAHTTAWAWEDNDWKIYSNVEYGVAGFNVVHETKFDSFDNLDPGQAVWLNIDFPPSPGCIGDSPTGGSADDNFSLGTAKTIGLEDWVIDTVDFAKDEDFFRFSAKAGSYYAIQIVTLAPAIQMSLSCVICDNYGDSSEILTHATIDQELVFKATALLGETGIYHIRVLEYQDDYNDSWESPFPITQGNLVTGRIEVPGDQDVFQFVAHANVGYKITVTPVDIEGKLKLRCALGLKCSGGVAKGEPHKYTLRFAEDTTVTFKIAEYRLSSAYPVSSVGNYTLLLEEVADDHGESSETATELTVGGVSGSIDFPDEADYFKFMAQAGVSYLLSAEIFSPYPLAAVVLECLNCGASNETRVNYPFSVDVDQYVYFKLSPIDSTLSDYRLTLTESSNDDHGNIAAYATPLTLGVAQNGSLEAIGDQDVFSFITEANKTYSFIVKRGNFTEELFFESADLLFEGNVYLAQSQASHPFSTEEAKTVYFTVRSYDKAIGSYEVVVAQIEEFEQTLSDLGLSEIVGPIWYVEEDLPITPEIEEAIYYSVKFTTAGLIGGINDCNTYSGSYRISGSTFYIYDMKSTMAVCGSYPSSAPSSLDRGFTLKLQGDTLLMTYNSGSSIQLLKSQQ